MPPPRVSCARRRTMSNCTIKLSRKMRRCCCISARPTVTSALSSNPDVFDLHREERSHLGMGSGIHFCVGAPLGRLMSYAIFEAVLAASDCWQIDLEQAQRVTTPNFRGFAKLPLTLA